MLRSQQTQLAYDDWWHAMVALDDQARLRELVPGDTRPGETDEESLYRVIVGHEQNINHLQAMNRSLKVSLSAMTKERNELRAQINAAKPK
jgi:hypothetical protein